MPRFCEEDEGALSVAIGIEGFALAPLIVLEFGKEVSWLGLDPEQAIDIAMQLVDAAMAVRGEAVTRLAS